jgi:uncharacterized protein (DUF169 family)
MKNEYSELSERLAKSLNLQQPPISISFANSVPAGIEAHAGRVPAGCQFWEHAATATFATSAADYGLCAIGVYTHNLQPSPVQETDLMDALKVFGDLGYVRQEDLAQIPVLEARREYVLYSPLADTPLPPDVVLMFVNANQTLILSEATQQVENRTPPAMGRPACAIVPQVMNTGRASLSLGCCGARVYLDVLTDSVAIFAVPGGKLEAYTQRIEALSNANTILSKFHRIRLQDVLAGRSPTVQDSLAALSK